MDTPSSRISTRDQRGETHRKFADGHILWITSAIHKHVQHVVVHIHLSTGQPKSQDCLLSNPLTRHRCLFSSMAGTKQTVALRAEQRSWTFSSSGGLEAC